MDAALDAALLVFRERGYHAASLGELGAAMKLTAGSIYKAFADKRAIFLAALERHVHVSDAVLLPLLAVQKSGYDKLRVMLGYYAERSYGIEGRRGCVVVVGATELATFDAAMAGQVIATVQRVENRLRDLIRIGQSDGSISARVDRDATALMLFCLVQGFRLAGKTKRSRAEMQAAVDQTLQLLVT